MSDLEKIAPQPVTINVGGKDVAVRPLKVRQIQPVLVALGPALRDGFGRGFSDAADWLMFFEAHTERVIDAVAAATEQPQAFLGELEPRELMELAFVVVEVNRDFFTRQVTPAIERLSQTLTKLGLSDGSILPPSADTDPGKLPS